MATPFVLTDAKVYLAQYDLSGSSNQVSIGYEYAKVPATVFGADVRYNMAGIPELDIQVAGLDCADGTDEVDDVLWSKLGTANTLISVGATGADGSVGYFTKFMQLSEGLGGNIGDAFGFQASGCGQGYKLVRGYYLAPAASRTSSASGTAKEISAVSATQKVYAILHVFSASGTSPTLDVIVESDDATGFSSAETRISFTQATDVTSELKSADGAITDDCWRVGWTIGGSDTPTFNFAVLVGII